MKRIFIITTANDIQIAVEKGRRWRMVFENLKNGVRFAPPLIRPDQWKAAIKHARTWTPPTVK